MRLLFLLSHPGLYRIFERPLALLADRGHELTLALDSERYCSDALAAFVAARENVTRVRTTGVGTGDSALLGHGVRSARDYLRYLEPRYADAPKLRERARRQVPAWLRPLLRDGLPAQRIHAALGAIERRLPLDSAALRLVEQQRPDVVALSPLFGFVSQAEVVRAARALGVPTCLPVASWDNLTSKGLIRPLPDRVLVWNAAQRREAVQLHGVPELNVTITGAQTFDEWFERRPATTPAAFARRVGLREDRPFLLYLASSLFIAPDEARFVVEWLRALRAHPDERLRDVGVLVRPHPQNVRHWGEVDLSDDPQVAIHPPPAEAAQITRRVDWSREDAHDSMAHAAAVVGINTTAMIEAAIVGRGVFTMLSSRFRATQEGTLHFEHLRSAGGGLLHLSDSFDAHFAQLAEALGGDGESDPRSRRFVEAFVRPHGLDRAATPLMVDALEGVAQTAACPAVYPARPGALLRPLATVAGVHARHGARIALLLRVSRSLLRR
ncbi:MAG TPA: hypothetical protein VGV40_09895 [Solirubrobacteraceae bacterium]|nr:hypothetical protein [Solirubrobacteraceae bacterium]